MRACWTSEKGRYKRSIALEPIKSVRSAEIQQLAEAIIADADTFSEKRIAIERYLQRNYRHTSFVSPDPNVEEVIANFLLDTREGNPF